MGFWQPLHLTHTSREIPEHSSAKAPGKGTSSMLDTPAGEFTLWGEELFGGGGGVILSPGVCFPLLVRSFILTISFHAVALTHASTALVT